MDLNEDLVVACTEEPPAFGIDVESVGSHRRNRDRADDTAAAPVDDGDLRRIGDRHEERVRRRVIHRPPGATVYWNLGGELARTNVDERNSERSGDGGIAAVCSEKQGQVRTVRQAIGPHADSYLGDGEPCVWPRLWLIRSYGPEPPRGACYRSLEDATKTCPPLDRASEGAVVNDADVLRAYHHVHVSPRAAGFGRRKDAEFRVDGAVAPHARQKRAPTEEGGDERGTRSVVNFARWS